MVDITPDLAKKWLAQNTHNRNLRERVVNGYAADMRDGNWVEDGQSISTINPGLTYDVALVFEQGAGWTKQDVTVDVRGYTFLEEDPLTLDPKSWLLGDDVAQRGELPVKVNP